MRNLNRASTTFLACALITMGTLMTVFPVQAANEQEIEFNEGSRGGVEIKFRNGCWISYDKNAKRGGNAGYCSPPQYQQADEAALTYLKGGGNSHDNPVPENQMQGYCEGEASSELRTRSTNIATNPARRRGSDFVVTGQSPKSGYNVTVFECVFGKRGMWKGFQVTQQGNNTGGGSHDQPVPESQMESYCAGEASSELRTGPNNISTNSFRKRGSDFVVTGQSPRSGYNVTVFECVFGKRGMWKGFQVTQQGNNTGGSSHDQPVPESQMRAYCEGEASSELRTRPSNIATNPVRKRGSDFVVTGQSPRSGYNVTYFECLYGKRGMWKGFQITSGG